MENISIIGLGKLGACMAAVYANKIFSVTGVDINSTFVEKINNKQAPVKENQLEEFIKSSNNLKATSNYNDAILNSEITFIIVPTPSDEAGGFSVEYVLNACAEIGKALANKDSYHLVVLTSTVLPGDSQDKIIPVLEKYSGKLCGQDFGYCYSPEFIAIGSVINDLLNPDFFLIGQSDEKAGQMLQTFYTKACNNNAPCQIMNIPSAELAKISLNSYVTTKITFSNMLAEIAEHIPGADVTQVLGSLGQDKRIGSFYLKSGLGFGGPCFPRDNIAFAHMANKHGASAPLASIVHEYNGKMVSRIANIILNNVSKDKKIGFLGLAYKPGTNVVEESHALKIVKRLIELGYKINVYEPAGHECAKLELKDKVLYCKNLDECIQKSDVYFISNPQKEFKAIVNDISNEKIIIDPWRILENYNFDQSVKYITLGLGK